MAAPVAALFSCGTCRVKFADLEFMQAHYKCDWHRYNLKRKVAALPPIGVESFAEIVKAYQSEVRIVRMRSLSKVQYQNRRTPLVIPMFGAFHAS